MSRVIKLKTTPRKRRVDHEGNEQISLFLWLQLQHPEIYEMAFHTPNGGKRNPSEAARFKKQGVKAGYPDIAIDIPRNGYHGLRIEIKATPPNDCRVSESQKQWIEKLNNHGFKAVVCLGLNDAKQTIKDYFNI